MSHKLVSVIMSVYNGEKTIEKSIDSILNQDYKNIELLLLDDCSEDKTFEICERYTKLYENVKLFRNKKNLGLTKSLNILANYSEGYYLARQDADDFSSQLRISSQLEFIKNYNLDACCTRAYVMNTKKITPAKSFYLPKSFVMKIKNPFIHGTLIIKKSVFNKVGQYDENFYYSQDFKLMSDLINNKFKIKILKEPLYSLNLQGNISLKNKKEQQFYAYCVKKKINPKDLI